MIFTHAAPIRQCQLVFGPPSSAPHAGSVREICSTATEPVASPAAVLSQRSTGEVRPVDVQIMTCPILDTQEYVGFHAAGEFFSGKLQQTA